MKQVIIAVAIMSVVAPCYAQEVLDVESKVIPAVAEKVEYSIPARRLVIHLNEGESLVSSPVVQEWATKVVPEGKSAIMTIDVVTKVSAEQMDVKPADTIVDKQVPLRLRRL
jgi:hypothetical protein